MRQIPRITRDTATSSLSENGTAGENLSEDPAQLPPPCGVPTTDLSRLAARNRIPPSSTCTVIGPSAWWAASSPPARSSTRVTRSDPSFTSVRAFRPWHASSAGSLTRPRYSSTRKRRTSPERGRSMDDTCFSLEYERPPLHIAEIPDARTRDHTLVRKAPTAAASATLPPHRRPCARAPEAMAVATRQSTPMLSAPNAIHAA
jgi:hypothetical protein